MKKFFPLILVFILSLTLSSCKGTKSDNVVIENLPESIWEGESVSLTGKYTGDEGRYFYEWSTSNSEIASIKSTTDGVEVLYSEAELQTYKRGTVTITLKIYANGKSSAPVYKEYTLKVINETDLPEVENFGFDFSSLTLKVGESLELSPNVSPEGSVFKETVSYASEYPEIASIDFTGKITALSKGDTVISITYREKSLDIDVSVISVSESIDLKVNLGEGYTIPEETININKGDKIYYKVSFSPANTDTKTFGFYCENSSVISVGNGYIEALMDGQSSFTVYALEYPALRKSINIIVTDPDKPVAPTPEEDEKLIEEAEKNPPASSSEVTDETSEETPDSSSAVSSENSEQE
ncbi:MAG: Ig-like domain-containing protein [Oscillospiraceae bacterium]|nr:Ig-like domain-containing protein [Oscillospiraceae bacterium]